MIRVVSAIIVRHGKLLVQKRAPPQDFPWLWETPGGKVEEGETEADALERELVEELIGADRFLVRECVHRFRPSGVRKEIEMVFFNVDIQLRTHANPAVQLDLLDLRPLAACDLKWVDVEELRSLMMTPGSGQARHVLRAALS